MDQSYTPGYVGPIARMARRPRLHTKRLIGPVGIGDMLTGKLRGEVDGLLRQDRPSGAPEFIPLPILRRMRMDPQIRIALRFGKAPLYTASFWIEGDDPAEEAWLEEVFVRRICRPLLKSSFLAHDFGFSPHELTYRVEDLSVSWEDPETGEDREQDFTESVLLHSASPIRPEWVTVLREPETYRFAGIEVDSPSGRTIRLEPSACFVFASEAEYGNIYGRARSVSAYDPWYDGQALRYFWNRYLEVSGAGQLVVHVPTDEEIFDANGNPIEDPISYYAQVLPDVVKSSSVLVVPGDIDPASKERKWKLEYLKLDSRKDEFQGRKHEIDVEKMRAMLVPERVATQDSNRGSYGMAEAQTENHYDALNEELSDWVSEVNDHLLPDVMRLNGFKGKAELKTTGISRESKDVLRRVYEKLAEIEVAIAQGTTPPQVLEELTAGIIDGTKLLEQMRIPVRRSPRRPIELRSRKGTGTQKDADQNPETGRTGGARMSRRIGLAVGELALSDLDVLYAEMLVAEEALLGELSRPYRQVVDQAERGARGIALLALLRARRQRADGTLVPGTRRFDRLVYDAEGKLLPMSEIAKNHDRIVAAAKEILPSVDGTELVQKGNKGLVRAAQREIEGAVRSLMDGIREIRAPGEYLDEARKLAGDHFADAAGRLGVDPGPLGEAARRPVPDGGLTAIPRVDLDEPGRELRDIEEVNEDGFDRNVENITIRGNRVVSEILGNAFFTGRRLAKEDSFLDQLLDWHLHPTYTDLTLEAHFRAVYRKVWLELSREAGLGYFRQYHPPITAQGEDEKCRGFDGRIGTYADWQEVARKEFRTADALDQFGMHYGCRAFWFPLTDGIVIAALKSFGPIALL